MPLFSLSRLAAGDRTNVQERQRPTFDQGQRSARRTTFARTALCST